MAKDSQRAEHPTAESGGSATAVHTIGASTDGGIDGTVIRVTTLAARGPGSLRAALETEGPRLVVFEVGGVIDLEGRTLTVRHPHLTLAGQTAPDPGITLIRGGLIVETSDVVIQHLAVRPGDDGPPGREWAPDALGVRGTGARNVLFEHCSATWSVDENLSTSGPADVTESAANITIRHCLIAEALSNATHPKGEHSKGTLIHDGVRNVLIDGCVYAHNMERNPRLKGGASALVRDSLMYNWGSACIGVGAKGNQKMLAPAEVTLVGNVAIAGPDTRGKSWIKGVDPGARALVRDNLLFTPTGAIADANVIVEEAPLRSSPREAAERALRRAGSRPARRDAIDARIVRTIVQGGGKLIDSQKEVGGYPVREATKRTVVVPENRRTWLAELSRELSEDRTVDVDALWKRLD